jgi:hypothetical protein
MENLQLEKHFEQTTSGLTAASQLVNVTSAISYEFSNTSSSIPEPIVQIPKTLQPSEPLFSGEIFKKALRRTLRRENKILDTLAKY